ncbi:MAG: 1-deoxy-D-xylulose-5-phosphate reductoisomerase [Hyphomonadaceae bacterium]|nr:1-deoxy-D-xylulose-5-phosphate reductoisomerase [Hyphomonadaceae bacterium]
MNGVRTISILGSTGSIGTSALSVVEHANVQSPDTVFEIDTLTGGQNAELLIKQARQFKPKCVVIADPDKREQVQDALSDLNIEVSAGTDAIEEVARRPVDRLLAAIVGISGLPSTLAAVEAGNSIALANKESMVCAGPLLNRIAADREVAIVPTDSEHNAMFQVMERREDVERIILTASGGPFRTASREELKTVTPRRALAHPRWDMGQKISIDSATLFNKGLELIEACYLFDLPEDQIEVVVHPQSILHSAVAYRDGSVLAQMGVPDMRTPIAHALTWPDRREPTPVDRLDLVALSQLDFEALDAKKFPAVDLSRQAIRVGKGAPIALNCANEGAVAAFLTGQCGFLDISWIVETVLERFLNGPMSCEDCENLEAILAIQAEAERLTGALLDEVKSQKQERTA